MSRTRPLAVDRCWNLVAANALLAPLTAGAAAHLLAPPVNVLRLSLHPGGLAPRIENLAEWRAHLLHRLRRQVEETGDADLAEASSRTLDLSAPRRHRTFPTVIRSPCRCVCAAIAACFRFWSATLVFGGPLDVTLSELMLETFLPADAGTAAAMAALCGGRRAVADHDEDDASGEFRAYAPMGEVKTLSVGDGEDGVRLDRWLRRRWPHLGQTQIHKLARSGQIRVDGARAKADTPSRRRRRGAGAALARRPVARGARWTQRARRGVRPQSRALRGRRGAGS